MKKKRFKIFGTHFFCCWNIYLLNYLWMWTWMWTSNFSIVIGIIKIRIKQRHTGLNVIFIFVIKKTSKRSWFVYVENWSFRYFYCGFVEAFMFRKTNVQFWVAFQINWYNSMYCEIFYFWYFWYWICYTRTQKYI